MGQIVNKHRLPLNERIEKETACLSVRNYCGDFFSRKIPLFTGRMNYCGHTARSLSVTELSSGT